MDGKGNREGEEPQAQQQQGRSRLRDEAQRRTGRAEAQQQGRPHTRDEAQREHRSNGEGELGLRGQRLVWTYSLSIEKHQENALCESLTDFNSVTDAPMYVAAVATASR